MSGECGYEHDAAAAGGRPSESPVPTAAAAHGVGHDHAGHDHARDHAADDHGGHDPAAHEHGGHDPAAHEQSGHDHAAHDHDTHEHAGHDHDHGARGPAGHDHDHDHGARGHAGHDHAHDHKAHSKGQAGHDHAGHDHSGHGHAGHDHAGHDHAGHDHAGHDHAGHDHPPGLRGWLAGLGHSHHDHSHGPVDFGRAFAVGIVLNLGFVAVEAAYGVLANSVALLADAGHNLSDVAGLVAAWAATRLARRSPSARFTYGMRGSSILAALFNAVLLLVAIGAIAWEAVRRLADPQPVAGLTVIAVAAAGIAVNGFTAWLFSRGGGDLNVRAAFAHMLSDALVSAGVVVAGGVILLTGWTWLDPVVSLVIGAIIVAGTWHLLRDSMTMALQGVPPGVELDAVTARLARLPGVTHVHHVHVWPVSTTETALTAHLLCPAGHPGDAFLCRTGEMLDRDFGIGHATLQIEMVAGSCG